MVGLHHYESSKKLVHFADEIFKAYCVTNFDTDGDGEISFAEALNIRTIYCDDMHITSLKGIEHFTNLMALYCNDNEIKTLDLSQNKKLEKVYCELNQMTRLITGDNPRLQILDCMTNKNKSS